MSLGSLRRIPRLLMAISVCVTGLCMAQAPSPPEPKTKKIKPAGIPKITIGKETTWATEPVGPDGLIDYLAVINRQYSQGVTPANNAAVLLYQAMGPAPDRRSQPDEFFKLLGITRLPDDGEYFEDLVPWAERTGHKKPGENDTTVQNRGELTRFKPWVEAEFPEIAMWLKDNTVPLGRVTDATERSEYYSPFVSADGRDRKLISILLPGVQESRSLARALLSRSMLHLGSNDRFSAWSDLMTTHRLGRLIGRGPTVIEGLVGTAIEHMAIEAELRLLSTMKRDIKFIARYRKQIENLPPISSMADKLNHSERLTYLDTCQQIARGKMKWGEIAGGTPDAEVMENIFSAVVAANVDWDEVLKFGNRNYDRIVDVARLPTFSERKTAIQKQIVEIAAMNTPPTGLEMIALLTNKPAATKCISRLMFAWLMPAFQQGLFAESRCAQRTLNVKLALALAEWRCEHDTYPESLAELAPKYLAAVPADLFNDQPLHYERAADGYRFYSVGENQKDDMGLTFGERMGADDLIVKMPVQVR
jgi:hypothetical protein